MDATKNSHISDLTLWEKREAGAHLPLQGEQRAARDDLVNNSHFQPHNDNNGPYALQMSIEDGRLVLQMKNAQAQELSTLVLSLKPYRRLIQDYFLMLQSYDQARQHATREKLEAIDMARRSLHNEGAELLMGRLKDKID